MQGTLADNDIHMTDYATQSNVGVSIGNDIIEEDIVTSNCEGQEKDIGDVDFGEGDINANKIKDIRKCT